MPRHFPELFDLDRDEVRTLLDLALDLKRRGDRGLRGPRLAGRILGLVFDKPSMRTRISFESAMAHLGGSSVYMTGKDVGTPIIQFQPPDGVGFFGPVISRLPEPEDALRLWDHVSGLAAFPGFAELKRSLRERPQLPAFGVEQGQVGTEEDWHAGSRRTRR